MKKLFLALALSSSTIMAAGPMDYVKSLEYSVGASATHQSFKTSYDNPRLQATTDKKSGSDTTFTADLSVRKEIMSCTTAGILLSISSRATHAGYWGENTNLRQKLILDNDLGYYASLGRRFNAGSSLAGHLSVLVGGRTMKVNGEQRNNTTGQRWNFDGDVNSVFSWGLNLELTVAKSKFRPFVRWTQTGEVKTKHSAIGSTAKDERLRSKLNTFYFGARYAF